MTTPAQLQKQLQETGRASASLVIFFNDEARLRITPGDFAIERLNVSEWESEPLGDASLINRKVVGDPPAMLHINELVEGRLSYVIAYLP